ncbi:serine/threonine-protein kinase [Actinacidiphila paucisporea]|uniref:Serine/threonine protein kinase n=1 Tax=Actinacidiphila paucisporea TaxID=310782 RepID=A0A1M7MI81_9ACTN|nr:serine/threonine-protein kinase [Actinacidiphila paucisporea]SHM90562.1 Serine/threonine protein kinase [Actinacidiphila paucisporea]
MAREPVRIWAPGDVVLGLYEVLDVVRDGGMGLVHKVRHRGWQVDLAVKTPRPERVRTQEDRRLFETEAGTWVGLGLHPHTVNCVYVRTIDALPRVFAEWVDGGSLAQAVRGGRLYEDGHRAALGRVLDIAVQMAWGLAHAHDSGLVHQDVKPANVMLQTDGTAKLTDFGLAGAPAEGRQEGADGPGDDPPGVTFGGMTPAYCSPEQAAAAAGRRAVRLTAATDVWSWAVSVLEMFAGRRLTGRGQAAGEALEMFLRGGGADDARVPAMPAGVGELLRQCLERDPAARPSGFREIAATLGELYRAELGTAYERPAPKTVRLLSDGLSNQALSLLDLGRTAEAEELWRRAAAANPHHLPTLYNFGLHRWRSGRGTAEELSSDLAAARAARASDGLGALLLGCLELERHEDERARELLREAVATDPDSTDAAAALAELARRPPRVRAEHDGHTGEVSAVAASSDGGLVLSGDRSGRLVLWAPAEQSRRRARHTLTRSGQTVIHLAVDAAGTLGAVLREDGSVETWDLARRSRLHRPAWPDGSPACTLAVSGDGRYVAVGRRDGTVWIGPQDRPDQAATVVKVHSGPVTSLALSRDGSRGVSASIGSEGHDGTVRAWAPFAGRLLGTLTGPVRGTLHGRDVRTSPLDLVGISPDARCAVVAWWRGPLTVWDARRCEVVSEVPHRLRPGLSITVASSGPTLLTAGESGERIQAWDPTTGRCLRALDREMPSDLNWVRGAALAAKGRVAVLGGARMVVVRSLPGTGYRAPWHYARAQSADELTRADDAFRALIARAHDLADAERYAPAAQALRSAQQVPGFARHPDLRRAWARVGAHGSRAMLLGAWPLYNYAGNREFTQPVVTALGRAGTLLATGRWTGEVDVWDAIAGERLHTFDRGEGGHAHDILFALDGLLLLVLTNAGTIRQLSLEDGGKRLFTDDFGRISAFALNSAGDRVLIGDETGTLRMRDLPSGSVLGTVGAHVGKVHAVALSPDGRIAATHGSTRSQTSFPPADDNEVHLWPLDADRPAWTLPSRGRDELLDFSPDGRTLFLSTGLRTTAWDVASGALRYSVDSGGSFMAGQTARSFSDDGRLAATPGREEVQVWETATGRVLHSLPCGMPYGFTLSADGTFAVTGGWDGLLRVWDLRSGRCLRTLEGHEAPIARIELSPDGTLLATADLGSALRVWELAWDYTVGPGDGD